MPLALLQQAAARALRPAQRGAALDPAADRRAAPHDRPRAALPPARRLRRASTRRADELIEAVLADEPQDVEPLIGALEAGARDRAGRLPRDRRSCCRSTSSLWAVVRGLDRRRVFKFAYESRSAATRASCTSTTRRAAPRRELPRRGRGARGPQGAHGRCSSMVRPAGGSPPASRDADRPALYFAPSRRCPGARARGRLRGRALARSSAPAALVAIGHRAARRAAVAVRRPPGAAGHRRLRRSASCSRPRPCSRCSSCAPTSTRCCG